MTKRKLGWMPELMDKRAYAFVPRASVLRALPESVDLRPQLPPIWNQGSIGSCTAHAVAVAHIVAQKRNRAKPVMPSRLALYFNSRALRGWQNQDFGAYICDVFKVIAKQGVANEKLYPYLTSKVFLKPPASVTKDALLNQAVVYRKLNSTNAKEIKAALADGHVVVFGSVLYEGYDQLNASNLMPNPDLTAKQVGGHAMALCGYDSAKQQFLVRNSWGCSWGDKGYHWCHESYITDISLTDDMWICEAVEK